MTHETVSVLRNIKNYINVHHQQEPYVEQIRIGLKWFCMCVKKQKSLYTQILTMFSDIYYSIVLDLVATHSLSQCHPPTTLSVN